MQHDNENNRPLSVGNTGVIMILKSVVDDICIARKPWKHEDTQYGTCKNNVEPTRSNF